MTITRLRLIPSKFDPDGDVTDLMWYGFVFEDQDGNRVNYYDQRLRYIGCGVFKVAGVTHRKAALQKPCFAPCSVVLLVPEDNPYDKNAVGVWDENKVLQVGYVPREETRLVRSALAKGDTMAISISEATKRRRRVSLSVLYGPLDGLLSR